MNNDPNRYSKQCPESKLSRVHSVPTLGPASVHTTPCRRPGLTVSQCTPCRVAHCALRVVSSCPHTCFRAYRSSLRCIVALPAAYRGASPSRVAPVSRYTQRPGLAHTLSAVSRALCVVSWRIPYELVARCAAPPSPVSRYTPLYRDSIQANGQ